MDLIREARIQPQKNNIKCWGNSDIFLSPFNYWVLLNTGSFHCSQFSCLETALMSSCGILNSYFFFSFCVYEWVCVHIHQYECGINAYVCTDVQVGVLFCHTLPYSFETESSLKIELDWQPQNPSHLLSPHLTVIGLQSLHGSISRFTLMGARYFSSDSCACVVSALNNELPLQLITMKSHI